jgi:DnaK suppressor protein
METVELEQFKKILQDQMAATEQPLRRREEIAVENAPDTIDRVQRAAERDLAIRQIESDFTRLQSLRLSLERIADGSYGTCLRCDDEIGMKRLKAVPWASFCIRCQDLADRERKDSREELLSPLREAA